MAAARLIARSVKGWQIDSSTSARDGLVQTAPWFNANRAKPSSALSRKPSSLLARPR